MKDKYFICPTSKFDDYVESTCDKCGDKIYIDEKNLKFKKICSECGDFE